MFQQNYFMSDQGIFYFQRTKGLIEMLALIGGLSLVLYYVLDLLLYPIASHSFFMRALKRLYLARTKDPHLASF